MQHVDEPRLESDLQYRYEYLAEFIGFGPDEVRTVQSCAPVIGPWIAEIVAKTYETLLEYDATARHLVPRQHGFEGEVPVDLASLDADHPQVAFRRDHLSRYLLALIGRPYDAKMVLYLDTVGRMHTAKAGNSEIVVPLVQMNALLGLLADLLLETLLRAALDESTRSASIRAINKLLWIQNDLVSRHYVPTDRA